MSAFQQGLAYLRRGLDLAGRSARLQLQVLVVYSAPAIAAGLLSASAPEPSFWQWSAMALLPWTTLVLGTTVMMVVVGRQDQGRNPGLARVSWEGLLWTPRYFWTNVHTSLIFWPPVVALLEIRQWQQEKLLIGGPTEILLDLVWWTAIGLSALYLHIRTLLAPFLAVHSDLPATVAVIEGWRLSGRHLAPCVWTFILALLPVGLPVLLAGLWLVNALRGEALQAFLTATPDFFAAAIQAVRPVLIPAVFLLYKDLWQVEQERRQREGSPQLPAAAGALLALTRPLPKPGRWT